MSIVVTLIPQCYFLVYQVRRARIPFLIHPACPQLKILRILPVYPIIHVIPVLPIQPFRYRFKVRFLKRIVNIQVAYILSPGFLNAFVTHVPAPCGLFSYVEQSDPLIRECTHYLTGLLTAVSYNYQFPVLIRLTKNAIYRPDNLSIPVLCCFLIFTQITGHHYANHRHLLFPYRMPALPKYTLSYGGNCTCHVL